MYYNLVYSAGARHTKAGFVDAIDLDIGR